MQRKERLDSTVSLLQGFKNQPVSDAMVDGQQESKSIMRAQLGERLLSAARLHDVKKTRASIQFGADVNYQDPTTGKTALMIIAARPCFAGDNMLPVVADSVAIAKMLLAEGADRNLQDNSGKTALMHIVVGDYVCPTGREKMTRALLFSSRGASFSTNANLIDKEGKTALDYFIVDASDRRSTHKGVMLVANITKHGAAKYKAFEAELNTVFKLEKEYERIMDEENGAEHQKSWWNCLC